MVSRGQSWMPRITISMASRGEGGNCGHHQTAPGCRARMRAATFCAFIDCGDERKPCRYNRWVVVGAVVMAEG